MGMWLGALVKYSYTMAPQLLKTVSARRPANDRIKSLNKLIPKISDFELKKVLHL